jgi:hypothetical protein
MSNKIPLIGMAIAFAVFTSPPSFAAEQFEEFTIKKVTGDSCKVTPKGGAEKPAKENDVLKSGARGQTGGGQSSFVVAFDDQNQFRLLPRTDVVISTSTRDSRFQKVIDLTMGKGSVEVDLKKFPKGYQMKVQTPTAVCGAVGTEFTVQSESREENVFECRNGTIFANSLEDGSFDAPRIAKGQSLTATAAPGKENSYAQLKTSGDMPIAIGSKDNKLDVRDGSTIEVAQEKRRDAKLAVIKVNRGGINDGGKGRYLMKDGKMEDLSKDEKVAEVAGEYVALTQAEGKARSDVERIKSEGGGADELSAAQKRLDEKAKLATAKREELFNRGVTRNAVRDGMKTSRDLPTRVR